MGQKLKFFRHYGLFMGLLLVSVGTFYAAASMLLQSIESQEPKAKASESPKNLPAPHILSNEDPKAFPEAAKMSMDLGSSKMPMPIQPHIMPGMPIGHELPKAKMSEPKTPLIHPLASMPSPKGMPHPTIAIPSHVMPGVRSGFKSFNHVFNTHENEKKELQNKFNNVHQAIDTNPNLNDSEKMNEHAKVAGLQHSEESDLKDKHTAEIKQFNNEQNQSQHNMIAKKVAYLQETDDQEFNRFVEGAFQSKQKRLIEVLAQNQLWSALEDILKKLHSQYDPLTFGNCTRNLSGLSSEAKEKYENLVKEVQA